MQTTREIVDRFFSARLGVSIPDLKPGQVAVATCDRRTYAERGYGFIRLLWVMHFGDRAVISVHPAAVAAISRLAFGLKPDDVLKDEFIAPAATAMQSALPGVPLDIGGCSLSLYHPGDAPKVTSDGEVRVLTATDAGACRHAWAGERRYMHAAEHPCAARGEAFGLFLGDKLIADAMTHDPSVAELAHLIAEDGIEVAEAYRGRGYGKAVFAAWTRAMQAKGKVCIHSTSLDNVASIALARSIGYVEYARRRDIKFNPPEEK